MRHLGLGELNLIYGGGKAIEELSRMMALVIGSLIAGGAAGHISGSILGYRLATTAGAGVLGATISGITLGIGGAYAGAYLLAEANTYLYSWALEKNDLSEPN